VRYERDDLVMHIELRRWAHVLVIAPLDANTLAKLANGLADNCLTCVWRAWDTSRPVVLAPAMNTLMWEHPLTRRHLRQLAADWGAGELADGLDRLRQLAADWGAGELADVLDLEGLVTAINDSASQLRIVPPLSKRLACGDVGMGALAELDTIVAAVAHSV
jgi:phosphopantothenoylcysteine decarboxylase